MLGELPIWPSPQVIQSDNDERMEEGEEEKRKEVSTRTRRIEITYPPPDIRNLVDQTSQFVANTGPEFEDCIMTLASHVEHKMFCFLNSWDPYHAYYQHRQAEARSQSPEIKDDVAQLHPSALFRAVCSALKPHADHYTVRIPEGIIEEELEVIQLTAQFHAVNGKPFSTELTRREMNNPQFDFLKPTHSFYVFYLLLTFTYMKVLCPPARMKEGLRESVADNTTVLGRCLHKFEWERSPFLSI